MDAYILENYKRIKKFNSKKEIIAVLNSIYEDGYNDGINDNKMDNIKK